MDASYFIWHQKAGMPPLGLTEAAMSRCCCGPVHGQGTYRGQCQRRDVFGMHGASVMQESIFGVTEPPNPCSFPEALTHTGLPLLVPKEDKFSFISTLSQNGSLQDSEIHVLYQLLIMRAVFPLSKDSELSFPLPLPCPKPAFRKRI